MPVKRLLILANSVKKRQHCVAGRIVLGGPKGYSYGDWIRPVSADTEEGELTSSHCTMNNGQQVKVYDVVDIPLAGSEGSAAQPENWLIDSEQPWKKVGDQGSLEMPSVNAESPPDLWLAPSGRADRITQDDLAALNRPQSLYLIHVRDFEMELAWSEWGGRGYYRRRAHFTYNGQQYDLSLTDRAVERFLAPVPPNRQSRKYQHPTGPEKILCVSLSAPYKFDQKHHKIVATVFDVAK